MYAKVEHVWLELEGQEELTEGRLKKVVETKVVG